MYPKCNLSIICDAIELDNFDQYYKDIFISIGYTVKYYHHPAKRHGILQNPGYVAMVY